MIQLTSGLCQRQEFITTTINRSPPRHGFSHSSVKAVLSAAGEIRVERGANPPTPTDVWRLALEHERMRAGGRAVAAQDVTAIVHGDAVCTLTTGDGDVASELVATAASAKTFVARHIFWAYDPSGLRHDVPGLLDRLLVDCNATGHVRSLSEMATHVAAAFRREDIQAVAKGVNACREIFFERWNCDLISPATANVSRRLARRLGDGFLGWKPPGAGAADSLIGIVCPDCMHEALGETRAAGWRAYRATMTCGLVTRNTRNGFVASAPMRIDLVGAADLGQNLGLDGKCFGLAIEPRSELRLVWNDFA